jgi:hypothetical protein
MGSNSTHSLIAPYDTVCVHAVDTVDKHRIQIAQVPSSIKLHQQHPITTDLLLLTGNNHTHTLATTLVSSPFGPTCHGAAGVAPWCHTPRAGSGPNWAQQCQQIVLKLQAAHGHLHSIRPSMKPRNSLQYWDPTGKTSVPHLGLVLVVGVSLKCSRASWILRRATYTTQKEHSIKKLRTIGQPAGMYMHDDQPRMPHLFCAQNKEETAK